MDAARLFVSAVFFCMHFAAGAHMALPPQPGVAPGQVFGAQTDDGSRHRPSRRDGGGENLFRRSPLSLPSEQNTLTQSTQPASSESLHQRIAEAFGRAFPILAASIIFLLGIIIFKSWRQNAAGRVRKKNYKLVMERDWQSAAALRQALEAIENFRDQAADWTPEQLNTYRENDIQINQYDYDRLWDVWKRYELRGFEPEVDALAESKWTEKEIIGLMRLYVSEMKARWEILRQRERGG